MILLQGIIMGLLCLVVYVVLWELPQRNQRNDWCLHFEYPCTAFFSFFPARQGLSGGLFPFSFFYHSIQSNGQYPRLLQKVNSFFSSATYFPQSFCKSNRGKGAPSAFIGREDSKTQPGFFDFNPDSLLRLIWNPRVDPTSKSQKPLNPLKGTLKSSLIFNEFPFRGRGKEVENQRTRTFLSGLKVIFAVFFLMSMAGTIAAATITSTVAGGFWSNPASWAGGVVPVAGDDVTIADGAIVTVDTDTPALGSLTIGQLSAGTLQYEPETARTITVSGIVTVKTGSVFLSAPSGSTSAITTHSLVVGGSIINNGTINFSANAGTGGATANASGAGITFTGAKNATFDCSSASLTNLRQTNGVTLNKGTSGSSVLSFTPGNTFQVLSDGTTGAKGFLSIVNGTFNIIGSNTFSNPVFNTDGSYTIPATGGFWLGNQNATVRGMDGGVTNLGELKITNGTLNVGISGGNSTGIQSKDQFIMSGGRTNINGRFDIGDGECRISGGKISIVNKGGKAGHESDFNIAQQASLLIYGDPLITIEIPNPDNESFHDIQILEGTGSKSITGGTFLLGIANTPAGSTFYVNSDIPFYKIAVFNECILRIIDTSKEQFKSKVSGTFPKLGSENGGMALTAPENKTVKCNDLIPESYSSLQSFLNDGGKALINCTLIPASFKRIGQIQSGTSCPYTLTRTYQVTDIFGNTGTVEHLIFVEGEAVEPQPEAVVEPAKEEVLILKSAKAIYTATQNGNWNDPATWGTTGTPTSADDVNTAGYTVSVNAASSCKNITIGIGGILKHSGTTSLTVTGNWNNSGTYTAGTGTVSFSNSGSTITGATAFGILVINTGSNVNSVISVNSDLTINDLQLINGLLKINGGTTTITALNEPTANPIHNTIPSSAGVEVNTGGKLITQDFTINNKGLIRINSGTANFGNSTGNSVETNTDGAFIVEGGGIVNIAGRLHNSAAGTVLGTAYISGITISSGTVTLSTFGNGLSSVGSLNVTLAGNFNFTGGTIVFQKPSTALTELDLGLISGGTKNTVGGTFQFGNGSTTGSPTFNISSQIPLYNITTGGNSNIKLENTLILGNPLTLNGSSKLFLNGNSIRIPVSVTGTYTFPIADASGTAIPATITLTSGTGAIASGAYIEVKTFDFKHSENKSATNYLNRYWTVTTSGITSPVYNVTATYTNADIAGTETEIAMGSYIGGLAPWVKYTNASANTLTATGITSTSFVFTGITSDPPTVTITAVPPAICIGSSSNLTATPLGDAPFSYSWSPAAGLSATNIANPVATPVSTKTYTITVTDGNGFSSLPASITVTVNPTPTATAPANQTYCNGVATTAIALTGTPAGVTFDITGGAAVGLANQTGVTSIPVFTPIAGSTTVSITPKANGCTGAAVTYTITVNPTPTATAPANQTYCNGVATTAIALTGTPAGVTFDITGGAAVGLANQTGVTSIPVFTPIAGSATVSITPKANGCTGTAVTYTITVNPTPTATAPANQTYCNGVATTAIALTGTPAGVTFDITGGAAVGLANQTGVTSIPVFTPVAGSATVSITPKANGCTGTAVTYTITVNPLPTITLGALAINCPGAASFLLPYTATTGIPNTYSISTGTPALGGFNPVVNAVLGATPLTISLPANVLAGTYQFVITVRNGNGCVSLNQTFNVVFADNTPPTFIAPGNITINATGACSFDADPSKTGLPSGIADNCSLPANPTSYVDVQNNTVPPVCKYPFTIKRTWKVTDNAGNFTTHDQIITVRDVSPPQITSMPANKTVECNTNYDPVNPADFPTATDCSAVTFSYLDVITNGNCSGKATVTRTWIATDCSGNASPPANQTIEIVDTKAPNVTFPTGLRLESQVACPNDIPTEDIFRNKIAANDACGTVTVEFVREEYYGLGGKPGFCPSGLTRFYRVRDNCNNSVEVTHFIEVLSECQCAFCVNTPFEYANLETTPVWYSQNWERGGKSSACCAVVPPDDNCISFFVWLGKDDVGLVFSIFSGANPPGALAYKIDCEGAGTPVGVGKCLTGGRWYTLSFCKPGGNKNVYKIEAIKGVTSADNITTRIDCSGKLSVTGVISSTVTWTDKSGNGYERYLTPSSGSSNPTFFIPEADKNLVPPFIDFEVCGQISGTTICGANFRDCKTMRVNILPKILIDIKIETDKICEGHMPLITPTVQPAGTDYVYHWYNRLGVEILPSPGSSFLPPSEGNYSVKVTKMDGIIVCNESDLFPFNVKYDKTEPALIDPPPALELLLSCDELAAVKLQKVSDWLATYKVKYTGADGIEVTKVMTPTYSSINGISCGIIPVTFTATDQCGNVLTINNASIKIVDSTKPTISTQPPNGSSNCVSTLPNLDIGYQVWLANQGGATATDNCDGNLDWANNSGTQSWVIDLVAHTKTITITFRATDDCTNYVETTPVTYTLRDNLPPTINCPVSVEEQIAADQCSKTNVIVDDPVITDNCSVPTLTYSILKDDGTIVSGNGKVNGFTFDVGVNTVTYTVTDDTGLKASCSFDVWIKRLNIPVAVITCPNNPVAVVAGPGICTAYVTVAPPVIVDPCKTATYTIVNDFNNTADASDDYPVGTTKVTWTIEDNSLKKTYCEQFVTVIDNQLPSFISCPLSFSYPADLGKLFATDVDIALPTYNNDNCKFKLTWTITGATSDASTNPAIDGISFIQKPYPKLFVGANIITYTLTDASNNKATCQFTVTITSIPDITCLSPVTYSTDLNKCEHTVLAADADNPGVPILNSGSQPIDWTWIITNPDGTTVTGGSATTDLDPIPDLIGPYTFKKGTSTIAWHAQNIWGSDDCTQTVTVEDKQAPTLNATDKEFCVLSLIDAVWDGQPEPNPDITPDRPDWYIVQAGSLDLDMTALTDNCCATGLIISWVITFSDGHPSVSGTDQPSKYDDPLVAGFPNPIKLWGATNYSEIKHTITYTVTDCNSILNKTVEPVEITIKPRPNINRVP